MHLFTLELAAGQDSELKTDALAIGVHKLLDASDRWPDRCHP
jgi:hypothetical protein